VFVDDFIGLSQGPAPTCTAVRRILFHTLDEVLCPLDKLDNPCHQEPASVKKLRKGDAYWATRKEVLGWVLDCTQMTIELPSRRLLSNYGKSWTASPLPRSARPSVSGNKFWASYAP
jgi:hypothetical protein